jgi:hypothetical protein
LFPIPLLNVSISTIIAIILLIGEQMLWNSTDSFHHCDIVEGIFATSIEGVENDERSKNVKYSFTVPLNPVDRVIDEVELHQVGHKPELGDLFDGLYSIGSEHEGLDMLGWAEMEEMFTLD